MEISKQPSEECVKTPTDKVETPTQYYTDLLEANPERVFEIKMYLRRNGVSDQILHNWKSGRSKKLNGMQVVLIDKMIKDLKLKTAKQAA